MQANVEIVSVAMAKEYLARALPNRPLSESVIARYVADMTDGLWLNNGQGIVLSDTNELLDGQHRLHAIVRYGQPISMLVVRGVPKQAFVTMDSGKGRKLPDVLGIEGYKYRFNLAASSRLAFNYIAGVAQSYTTSRGVLERFIKNHPYLAEIVDKVGALHTTKLPRSQLAAIIFLGNESRRHDKTVEDFLEGLVYGERLWRGDARLTFREWHQRVYIADRRRARGDTASLALLGAIGRAWNAFGEGRELSVIKNAYMVTRESMEVYGFDPTLYHDVPDLAVKNRESALQNLQQAHKANAFKNKTETAPTPAPEPNSPEAKAARLRVQGKAMAKAAHVN